MLSNEETAAARRLIEQYRSFAKQWRFLRWLLLVTGVLMLLIMAVTWQQLARLEVFDAAVIPIEPTANDIKALLNERIDMLRLELKLYIAVFLHAVLGPALIVAALYGWNRWVALTLLKAQLLETAVANELAANRSFEFMKSEDA